MAENMKAKLEKLLYVDDAYQQASLFLSIIREELEICDSFLRPQESKEFRQYYHYLENTGGRHLSYWQNQYAPKVQYLVGSSKPGSKVLDAGCGLGTEAILSGILGAEVSGIDLSIERLTIADKRAKFYQQQLGRLLTVNFSAQSIFNVVDNFDVIWSQQSISHIEPAAEFIGFCQQRLEQGGKLIITDSNALNPVVCLAAKREQRKRGGVYTTKVDPQTGKAVPYAQERLFSVRSIRKLIEIYDFHIEKLITYGFSPYLPFSFRGKDVAYYTNWLDKVPVLKLLAAGYVVVATKI